MSTLEITQSIIAPIFIVVGIAALVDRIFDIEPQGISRLVVYLFTPFLVFEGLAYSELDAGEAGQIILVAFGTQMITAFVAWRIARLAGFDRRLESAFILVATLINAGNYGIPLNRFAFGAEGEARALLFFVETILVTNTLGVFLASRGSVSTTKALRNVLSVPLPYAAALGLIVNLTNFELPDAIDKSTALIADAAIPGMLVVLGIRLRRTSIREYSGRLKPLLMAGGLRMVFAPLVALGIVTVLGISGLTRQVSLVQAAMPTAVISGVLATEFGGDADFVTAAIFVNTLASIGTLSILLSLVM